MFGKKVIEIKTASEIAKMRIAGRAVAEILEGLKGLIAPGVSTKDINDKIAKHISSLKMLPAFLGYNGYPAEACVSVNEEVVHAIPSAKRVLKNGDIVSVDVGVIYEGYFGDAAKTYAVGEISETAKKLLSVTEESLYKAIEKACAGLRLGDVSSAVQSFVEAAGFSVVREFVGHGIGRKLHEEPPIPNFGKAATGVKLERGMALAIEPMVNAGGYEVEVLKDKWTVVTKDKSLSAHFEHTVIVTDNGAEILTKG